jgi:hypothetical protein
VVGKRCSCSGMMCVVAMHERRACLAGHDNKEVVSFVTLRCIASHCVRAGLQMQHATCNMQESPAFFAQLHGVPEGTAVERLRLRPYWPICALHPTRTAVRC